MEEIRLAYQRLRAMENVECLVGEHCCELTYLQGIIDHLQSRADLEGYEVLITDHLTGIREPAENMLVFFLSNEDHRLPDFAEEVALTFTPYPPLYNHSKVKPIPLGPNGKVPHDTPLPVNQRKPKLFFSGRKINRRASFLQGLEKLEEKRPGFTNTTISRRFEGGIDPATYAKMLNEYLFVPAPEGNFSDISFRFFEAARQGGIVLAPSLPDFWFFRPFPGVIIEDWHQLPEKINTLLENPDGLQTMQNAILAYYRDYCSETAVAEFILGEIEKPRR